jgi:hypothetical protein
VKKIGQIILYDEKQYWFLKEQEGGVSTVLAITKSFEAPVHFRIMPLSDYGTILASRAA